LRLRATSLGSVDAQHVRAEIGEDHAAERRGRQARDLDDAHAVQWTHVASVIARPEVIVLFAAELTGRLLRQLGARPGLTRALAAHRRERALRGGRRPGRALRAGQHHVQHDPRDRGGDHGKDDG
jgi:hypothetical protein